MKDYIYLDEDLLNSNLAQLQRGLPTHSQVEDSTGTNKFSNSSSSNAKGIDNFFGFGPQLLKQNGEIDGFEMTSSQKEVLNSVFHDYAVDLLLESIPEYERFITDAQDAEEGDFVYIKDKFLIYDFNHLSKVLDINEIKPCMGADTSAGKNIKDLSKELQKIQSKVKNPTNEQKAEIENMKTIINGLKAAEESNKKGIENIELIKKFADYSNNLFSQTTLIRVNSGLVYAKKDCFRNSIEQISMLTDSKRNITIFGTVSAIKEKTHQNDSMASLKTEDIYAIPSIINDLMLSSFNILKEKDRLIKPIAIFFE